MEKKNLVFLDIDGVVNTPIISDKPFNTVSGKIKRPDGYYYNICSASDKQVSNKQAVLWLNKICLEGKADIVLASTWRFEYEDAIISLYNSGLNSKIQIIGATPRSRDGTRGTEISMFLENAAFIVNNYVILDDDADMGIHIEHLCLCNSHTGLGFMEYDRALKILDKRNN